MQHKRAQFKRTYTSLRLRSPFTCSNLSPHAFMALLALRRPTLHGWAGLNIHVLCTLQTWTPRLGLPAPERDPCAASPRQPRARAPLLRAGQLPALYPNPNPGPRERACLRLRALPALRLLTSRALARLRCAPARGQLAQPLLRLPHRAPDGLRLGQRRARLALRHPPPDAHEDIPESNAATGPAQGKCITLSRHCCACANPTAHHSGL